MGGKSAEPSSLARENTAKNRLIPLLPARANCQTDRVARAIFREVKGT